MVRDLESVNDFEDYKPDDAPMLPNGGGSFSVDSEQEDVCTFQVHSTQYTFGKLSLNKMEISRVKLG